MRWLGCSPLPHCSSPHRRYCSEPVSTVSGASGYSNLTSFNWTRHPILPALGSLAESSGEAADMCSAPPAGGLWLSLRGSGASSGPAQGCPGGQNLTCVLCRILLHPSHATLCGKGDVADVVNLRILTWKSNFAFPGGPTSP